MAQSETVERILDAAEQLFAEKGFAETSLRLITSKAGVNLAAVNYHFGSKKALIQAVFSRFLGPFCASLDRELERRQAKADQQRHQGNQAVLGATQHLDEQVVGFGVRARGDLREPADRHPQGQRHRQIGDEGGRHRDADVDQREVCERGLPEPRHEIDEIYLIHG